MATKHFDEAGFNAAAAQGGVMLVDFWADWCGPCRMLAPMIDQLADEYDGRVVVGKVNVDDEPELAQKYGVMSIPNIVILKDGKEVDRLVGVQPKGNFTAKLDKVLG
jgi:thioredoxin 1